MSDSRKGKRKADSEAKAEKKEKKTKKAKTKKGGGEKKKSQYKTIDKKKYDRGMLEAADEGVKAAGDGGKIGLEDAKKIVKEALDGHVYTNVEKSTMKYIREHFQFTTEADEYVRTTVASFAAKKAAKKKATGKGKGKGKGKKKTDKAEGEAEKAE